MKGSKARYIQSLSHTVDNLRYCMDLSWRASRKYTLIRILSELISPVLPITLAFLGKRLLDTLAQSSSNAGNSNRAIHCLLLVFSFYAIRSSLDHWKQYARSQHAQLIQKEVSLQQMQRALSMDLSFFDCPECYDQLVTSLSDASAISEELWYLLHLTGSLMSFVGTLALTISANALYAFVMLILSIPSAVITAAFTKRSYLLTLTQVNESRKVALFQNLAMDKRYAQELRLFNAKNRILDLYKTLWIKLFQKRQQLEAQRSTGMAIAELLPLIAMGGISIHLVIQVLAGTASVGDYSLYTGLLNEMLAGIMGLGASIVSLYDNRSCVK